MHDGWESVKGQHMLFVLAETPNGLWIALLILCFEGVQVQESVFLLLLVSDSFQSGHHFPLFTCRNSTHHVPLVLVVRGTMVLTLKLDGERW